MPSNYFENYGGQTITAATVAITADAHLGQRVMLARAAGVTATLPPATGSGNRYEFIVSVTPTSNAHVIRVTGNDVMFGLAQVAQDAGDTSVMFETAADSDTITLNGSTTGGLKGARITLDDVAADSWAVLVVTAGTGTEATPFSAAVS
jgi:hypothetical protein